MARRSLRASAASSPRRTNYPFTPSIGSSLHRSHFNSPSPSHTTQVAGLASWQPPNVNVNNIYIRRAPRPCQGPMLLSDGTIGS
jgi:hypothetical protein